MKLKDIPGVMLVEKKYPKKSLRQSEAQHFHEVMCVNNYNQALTAQGEVEVELDRDKVIEIINSFDGNRIIHTDYDSEPELTDKGVQDIAQAFSDNLPSILKVKK